MTIENNAVNTDSNDTLSAIDAAIAKAKARASERKSKGTQVSPEERQASRVAAKAERERIRANKADNKPTAHMTKVQKAGARLPSLGKVAQSTFDEVVRTLNSEQLTALALHIQHFNRVQATTRALTSGDLKVGQLVRITGGDPKYIGMTGAVETLRRIRCFVTVPGAKKPVYLFTSDVEAVTDSGDEVIVLDMQESPAATGTEG
ncbi:MAG: hypothetical protein EBS90_09445 [Betaproteobacteria bacterium]|nr:hypothetical protein [Betaproteobacteria bacterium]